MKHITIFWGLLSLLILCSCTNFEELRKDKFVPDYAVKNPTTFIESNPVNGRFLKSLLSKGEPIVLLKRGLGYSAVQLHSGRIGEVPSEDIRTKVDGETFEGFYNNKPNYSINIGPKKGVSISGVGEAKVNKTHSGVGSDSSVSEDIVEKFPILNNSLQGVEPDLPEW